MSDKARGTGEAADGRIVATVVGRRLESLRVEPRLLRLDPELLTDDIVIAVNAAFDDLRESQTLPDGVPVIDPLALARQLRQTKEELAQQVGRTTASLQENVTHLRRRAEVSADVPVIDFGDLFDELIDVLETIGNAAEDKSEELIGEGVAGQGRVWVTCATGEVIDATIEVSKMRGAEELAEFTVTAVNMALDDLEEQVRERQTERGADPERIKARLQSLSELNVERYGNYARSLSGLMGSIKPRR